MRVAPYQNAAAAFFVHLYTSPDWPQTVSSCLSLLTARTYMCTMPELNRIFFFKTITYNLGWPQIPHTAKNNLEFRAVLFLSP